jgi:hypothetical protein
MLGFEWRRLQMMASLKRSKHCGGRRTERPLGSTRAACTPGQQQQEEERRKGKGERKKGGREGVASASVEAIEQTSTMGVLKSVFLNNEAEYPFSVEESTVSTFKKGME